MQSRAKIQLFSVTVLCSINKSFCRRILLGSRNLRLETLKLEAGSSKLETRNSKLETRNSSFEKSKTSRIEFRASSRDCQLTFDRYCMHCLTGRCLCIFCNFDFQNSFSGNFRYATGVLYLEISHTSSRSKISSVFL